MVGRRILAAGAALALTGGAGLVAAQTPAMPAAQSPQPAQPVTPTPKAAPAAAAEPVQPPTLVVPPPAATLPAAPTPEPETPAPAPAPKAKEEEEKPPEPPPKRARYDVAVIQALDKVSARSVRFEAAVGKPVRYKSLVFTVRACERTTAEEAQDDSIAHVTIQSQPRPAPGKPTPPPRQAFRGWMYASSPGLNPLEHPIYDAWLITCRAASPAAVASR